MISGAGKASGTNKMGLNVKNIPQQDQQSVNFDLIDWKYEEEAVLMSDSVIHEVAEAKHREIINLKNHNVFEKVDDEGQEFIESKWIVTEKIVDGERVVKARLVAKGFQERNKHNLRRDSLTCTKENLHIMLALAATNSCSVKSLLDIKSPYLQGKEIERVV